MIRASLLTIAVAAALVRVSAAQAPADAIKAADQNWERVFAARDLDASVNACAPDGAVLPPSAPIAAGHEAIRKLFQAFFATPGFNITWHATYAEAARSGDLGFSTGVYTLRFNDASGNSATDTGKYVTVWKRSPDGKWLVVRDIFNSDLPPPTATK